MSIITEYMTIVSVGIGLILVALSVLSSILYENRMKKTDEPDIVDSNDAFTAYPSDLLKHYASLQLLHYLGHCQKLGILDAIPTLKENKFVSGQDISRECNLKNTENLSRTLRFLSLFGYTKKIKNGDKYYYIHTDLSQKYAKNNDIPYNEWAYYSLGNLVFPLKTQSHFSINEWLLNDITPFDHYHNTPLFGQNGLIEQKDNILGQQYVSSLFPWLESYGKRCVNDISDNFDFSKYNIICDIGGGMGQICASVLNKYSNIKKAIIFDTYNVIEKAKQKSINIFSQNDIINGRVNYVIGNFFHQVNITENADIYIIRHILHNWNDDMCCKIISNIRKSMDINDGNIDNKRVIINELLLKEIDEKYDINDIMDIHCLHFDMSMSLLVNGKQRTLLQFDNIMQKGGNFKRVSITSVGALKLIEYKPL